MRVSVRLGLAGVALALMACYAGDATAQATVTFTPAAPTAGDTITAQVSFQGLGCAYTPTTIVTGTTVQMTINMTGCVFGPPPILQVQDVEFGPLPQGTYIFELYFQSGSNPPEFQLQRTLVIAPAPAALPPVPTLNDFALLALIATLGVLALVKLGRF